MTYLVLFNSIQKITTRVPRQETEVGIIIKEHDRDHSISTVKMKSFTDPQEAADFAAKYDGYVVIPATIKSTITEGEKSE